MAEIKDTLAERGATYGDFREQGRITQNLKRAMQDSPNWGKLPGYMKEGLDMVQHKISRILNGNPLYDDNVHDILGYTKLMQDRMEQDREAGVTIAGGGDPLYPTYKHEDRESGSIRWKGIDTSKIASVDVHELKPINEVSYTATLRRVNSLIGHCMGKGAKDFTIDIRDAENLVHLAELATHK